jgi:hypothetical protein
MDAGLRRCILDFAMRRGERAIAELRLCNARIPLLERVIKTCARTGEPSVMYLPAERLWIRDFISASAREARALLALFSAQHPPGEGEGAPVAWLDPVGQCLELVVSGENVACAGPHDASAPYINLLIDTYHDMTRLAALLADSRCAGACAEVVDANTASFARPTVPRAALGILSACAH